MVLAVDEYASEGEQLFTEGYVSTAEIFRGPA